MCWFIMCATRVATQCLAGHCAACIYHTHLPVLTQQEERYSPQRNLAPHLAAVAKDGGGHALLDTETAFEQLLKENVRLRNQLVESSAKVALSLHERPCELAELACSFVSMTTLVAVVKHSVSSHTNNSGPPQ